MPMTPTELTSASFRTVRKGYDPDEVNSLLAQAATALEQAQQQATAMEARARAAVARLHEQTEQAAQRPAPAPVAEASQAGDATPTDDAESVHVRPDEAETISRTLLLAQRTADTTISEARADAERILAEARTEADQTLDSTREMSAQLVEEARAEARKVGESERVAAANEVESLKARREFLLGDVDQLESFLIDQRERLRGAAHQIEALCERIPSGLGSVSAPALSASDDDPGDDTSEIFMPPETKLPFADANQLAEALGDTPLEAVVDRAGSGDDASESSGTADGGSGPDTGELDATQPIESIGSPVAERSNSGGASEEQNQASI